MREGRHSSKLDGHKVSLAGYRGRNLVVAYWASWCGLKPTAWTVHLTALSYGVDWALVFSRR